MVTSAAKIGDPDGNRLLTLAARIGDPNGKERGRMVTLAASITDPSGKPLGKKSCKNACFDRRILGTMLYV